LCGQTTQEEEGAESDKGKRRRINDDGESMMSETKTVEIVADEGWEWAIVEIMGHRSHACRAREVEKFGAKMIRVDVPLKGDPATNGWETHFYGGASVFSYTPTDEASVMKINKPYDAVARYRLPAPSEHEMDEEPF
jgi:hypothetical protein